SMGAAPTFLCRAADNLRYSSTELFDTGRDIAWKLLAEVGKGALCFSHCIADVAGSVLGGFAQKTAPPHATARDELPGRAQNRVHEVRDLFAEFLREDLAQFIERAKVARIAGSAPTIVALAGAGLGKNDVGMARLQRHPRALPAPFLHAERALHPVAVSPM